MTEDELNMHRYEKALELLRFEGEMLWKIMSAFMVVHTIMLAAIEQLMTQQTTLKWLVIVLCIFGLLACLLWLGTFNRNTAYYHFRMSQAKLAEPATWELLNGSAEKFAAGYPVTVDGKTHHIKGLGHVVSNKLGAKLMIWMFIALYMVIIGYCCPCVCEWL